MKLSIKAGKTSQIVYVFIADSSSTTGGGLTGLTYNSAGLTAYYCRPQSTSVAITLATLAAVTSPWSSGGFKEVDATNMPGWYRFDVPDAVIAAFADSAVLHFKGATNMAPLPIEIALVAYDPQDAVRLGLSALPNAAAQAAGGLYTRGNGAGQIDQDANGRINTNVVALLGTNWLTPSVAGTPDVNAKQIGGTAQTGLDLGGNWTAARAAKVDNLDATVSSRSTLTQTQVTGGAYALNSASFAFNAALDFTTAQKAATLARVTLVDTATALTNLPAVTAGWLTSTGIADGAIDAATFAADVAALIRSYLGLATASLDTQFGDLPTAAENAAATEAAILNEADATPLLAAIAAKVEEFVINDGDATATLAAIAAAVRTNLAAELARIDVATSTRLASASYTAPDNASIAAILVDTNELQTDLTNGGRLDVIFDAILVDTAEIGAAGAGLTVLASATELAKVPKSDGIATWNPTALASINTQVDTAFTDYDPPTNAEMEARTLAAANYATASAQATAQTSLEDIPTNSELATALASLSIPTSDANAIALLDLANGVETGKTVRQAMRLIAAALAGKRSNAGTANEQYDAIGNPGTVRIVGNLNTSGDGTPTLTP